MRRERGPAIAVEEAGSLPMTPGRFEELATRGCIEVHFDPVIEHRYQDYRRMGGVYVQCLVGTVTATIILLGLRFVRDPVIKAISKDVDACGCEACMVEFFMHLPVALVCWAHAICLILGRRWWRRIGGERVTSVYWEPTCVVLLAWISLYVPFTYGRIDDLLGTAVNGTAACDAKLKLMDEPGRAPGHETSRALYLVLAHGFFGGFCRMRPLVYFCVWHAAVFWYGLARRIFGDYDAEPTRIYSDTLALYLVLFLVYLCLRGFDRQDRAKFVAKVRLEALAAAQAQRLEDNEEEKRLLIEEMRRPPPPTDDEKEALVNTLGAQALPDALRRLQVGGDKVTLRRLLGSGAFAEVRLAEWCGGPCAVKRLLRTRHTPEGLQAFKREAALHASLRHPNIVGLLGFSVDTEGGEVCLLLELCGKGTLEQLLREEEATMSWTAHKLPIAIGIARAMGYLHSQRPPVIHRDLKCSNVLVDDGYNAKLSDFGLSRERDEEETMSTVGSPLFSAPELLRRERYDEKVDVWAYGCILESLSTHRLTYALHERSDKKRSSLVAEGSLRPGLREGTCFIAAVIDQCARSLPDDRPSFADLVETLQSPNLQLAASAAHLDLQLRKPESPFVKEKRRLQREKRRFERDYNSRGNFDVLVLEERRRVTGGEPLSHEVLNLPSHEAPNSSGMPTSTVALLPSVFRRSASPPAALQRDRARGPAQPSHKPPTRFGLADLEKPQHKAKTRRKTSPNCKMPKPSTIEESPSECQRSDSSPMLRSNPNSFNDGEREAARGKSACELTQGTRVRRATSPNVCDRRSVLALAEQRYCDVQPCSSHGAVSQSKPPSCMRRTTAAKEAVKAVRVRGGVERSPVLQSTAGGSLSPIMMTARCNSSPALRSASTSVNTSNNTSFMCPSTGWCTPSDTPGTSGSPGLLRARGAATPRVGDNSTERTPPGTPGALARLGAHAKQAVNFKPHSAGSELSSQCSHSSDGGASAAMQQQGGAPGWKCSPRLGKFLPRSSAPSLRRTATSDGPGRSDSCPMRPAVPRSPLGNRGRSGKGFAGEGPATPPSPSPADARQPGCWSAAGPSSCSETYEGDRLPSPRSPSIAMPRRSNAPVQTPLDIEMHPVDGRPGLVLEEKRRFAGGEPLSHEVLNSSGMPTSTPATRAMQTPLASDAPAPKPKVMALWSREERVGRP